MILNRYLIGGSPDAGGTGRKETGLLKDPPKGRTTIQAIIRSIHFHGATGGRSKPRNAADPVHATPSQPAASQPGAANLAQIKLTFIDAVWKKADPPIRQPLPMRASII
jgi:hypothetical protein